MKKIRVRFAPSPTGGLHIGGLRTALYNYFFAKKHGGDFILRIEDTDAKRFVPESEAYINAVLEWFGINPDESPIKGGPYAPYRQSERSSLYQHYADELVKKGKAYYAFDSSEALEEMRAKQRALGSPSPKYNAITRMSLSNSFTLPSEEVARRVAAKEPYVIRLLVDYREDIKFKDVVRGVLHIKGSSLDDKVLLKEDGLPTYHLANVVDDHLMDITHVIRGEEWLPSTPIHLLLYKALGFEPPIFVHLPLLLRADGQGKLSKRMAATTGTPIFPINWEDKATGHTYQGFREAGYLPEALLNFIALLGWHPPGNEECFDREALCERFSLDRIHKAGVRFDITKAKWFNQHYLKKSTNQRLYQRYLLPKIQAEKLAIPPAYGEAVCALVKDRIAFPNELWEKHTYFFIAPTTYPKEMWQPIWSATLSALFAETITHLSSQESFKEDQLRKTLKAFVKENRAPQLMRLIRLALTGQPMGPDLVKTILLLGQKESIQRLKSALKDWQKEA